MSLALFNAHLTSKCYAHSTYICDIFVTYLYFFRPICYAFAINLPKKVTHFEYVAWYPSIMIDRIDHGFQTFFMHWHIFDVYLMSMMCVWCIFDIYLENYAIFDVYLTIILMHIFPTVYATFYTCLCYI